MNDTPAALPPPPAPPTVAYLGPDGTFSHQACLRQFGEQVQARPVATVVDVFEAVERGDTTFGMVPVENSTEGVIPVTFDLFRDARLQIAAELYLQVHQNLLAHGKLGDIRTVYSHPQSLAQCRHWLQRHLPGRELRELSSNSAAVQRAAGEPHAAAIAGRVAGARYGVPVLYANIEDFEENVTRFLVLVKEPALGTSAPPVPPRQPPPPGAGTKTSLMFAFKDRVGALFDALRPFKDAGVNLTMIHSRPSKKKAWDYLFFVDFIGAASDPGPASALHALPDSCTFVRVLGSYPRTPDPVE